MSWLPKEDAALKSALAERMTATQAAAHLTKLLRREISRCAVIGRARRIGAKINGAHENHRRDHANPKVKRAPTKKVAPQKPKQDSKAAPITPKAVSIVPPPIEQIAIPTSGRVALTELRDSMCKFPIGDPRADGFGFCGARKPIDGSPYCAFHARIAYAPVAERRRHDRKVRSGVRV